MGGFLGVWVRGCGGCVEVIYVVVFVCLVYYCLVVCCVFFEYE